MPRRRVQGAGHASCMMAMGSWLVDHRGSHHSTMVHGAWTGEKMASRLKAINRHSKKGGPGARLKREVELALHRVDVEPLGPVDQVVDRFVVDVKVAQVIQARKHH